MKRRSRIGKLCLVHELDETMEQENYTKNEIAAAALASVEKRMGVTRSTLLDRRRSLIEAKRRGECDADTFRKAEAVWNDFETARHDAEGDVVLAKAELEDQAQRAERRAIRVKLNERVRKFVTSYLPPAPVRHMPLGHQAVYNAIAQHCLDRGRTALTNEQVMAIAGVSKATVKRATRALHDSGIVIKTERYDDVAKTNLPNIYRLGSMDLLKWARRVFKSIRGVTSEPQLRTGLKPVSTRGAQQQNETKTQTKTSREEAISDECAPCGDDSTTLAGYDHLAKIALSELGENISTHAGPATIRNSVEKVRKKLFTRLQDKEWERHRSRLGRKADLALLETALLSDLRMNHPFREGEDAWKSKIRSPENYLHGILRRRREYCRPEVTLGRLMMTRDRWVPDTVRDAVMAHNARRVSPKRQSGQVLI